MKDTDKMPFGKHKGERLIDVPASYLLWLYSEGNKNLSSHWPELKKYIEDNLEALKKEK